MARAYSSAKLNRFAKIVVVLAVAGPTLQACGDPRETQFAFDGQFFRSAARKVEDDRQVFDVTVSPVSASLDGARAAARYEATRYCVETFGNSSVIWQSDPDAPVEALGIENDTLILRGMCEG